MKKTHINILFTILIVLLLNSIEIYSQGKKRYLLEEYTGAWCGWCPRGDYKVKYILQHYPDDIIPVAFHTNDKMEIEESVLLANAYSVAFPNGVFDRKYIDAFSQFGFGVLPEYWLNVIDDLKLSDTTAICDVNLNWAFDATTMTISTSIEAIFNIDYEGDLRFNVYIVEDSCSGQGYGWDQANYLSKNESFKNYPYYNMPNPITGFQHREVVRAMLAGPWGLEESIPMKVRAGEKYYAHLSYKIPLEWNIYKIKLVGIVQKYSDNIYERNVLNCNYGKRVSPIFQAVLENKYIAVKGLGQPYTINLKLKNISDKAINFYKNITFTQRTPLGWYSSFEIENSNYSLEPEQSVNCEFKFTPYSSIGIGDANCMIYNKDNPLDPGISFSSSIYSEEIERFQIIDDDAGGRYCLDSLIKEHWNYLHFNITSNHFVNLYKSFPSLKTIVWSSGKSGRLSQDESSALKYIINNGTRLFINGLMLGFINIGPLYDYLHIIPRLQEGTFYTQSNKYIDGFDGDPITSDIKSELIKYTFTTYLNTDKVYSFPLIRLSGTDTVIAARFQSENKKAVLMAINPNDIVSDISRKSLIKKTIDWLEMNNLSIEPYDTLLINVFYNQSQDKIIIKYYNTEQKQINITFEIYDLCGRLIAIHNRDFLALGENNIELDANSYTSGLYYIKVIANYGKIYNFLPLLITK